MLFMSVYNLFYIFMAGLPFGLFLALFWHYLEKKILLRKTRIEGEHILLSAQEKTDNLTEKHQEEFNKFKDKKLRFFEKEREELSLKLENLKEQVDKKNHQLKLKVKEKTLFFNKSKNEIQGIKQAITQQINEKQSMKLELKSLIENKIQQFISRFSINIDKLKEELKSDIEKRWLKKIRKELEKKDIQCQQNLQKDSYFYLNTVLNRFDRVYCPERGIGFVAFKNKERMENTIQYIKEIEKACGVDILIKHEELEASVFGIDPVRRELGRLTLNRLAKRNLSLNPHMIEKTVKHLKRDLFARIKRDGQNMAKKLKLKNVALEVKNMMGALRYRYSYAQNQYFHCEEVGWLCGLLSAELNGPLKSGQRAGVFHDIGKAMDHSIEGNHAVIGAEFLAQHGEKEEITHPVRAHHHDVAPSTTLAFLVIVADSISGSRPGARRFTEDSYNQKMATLERIIDSFKNIEEAYIMSAGREMRVIVDNKKVSDREALSLSQSLARKIEKECSYPGLIKVTVVRHSEVSAIA